MAESKAQKPAKIQRGVGEYIADTTILLARSYNMRVITPVYSLKPVFTFWSAVACLRHTVTPGGTVLQDNAQPIRCKLMPRNSLLCFAVTGAASWMAKRIRLTVATSLDDEAYFPTPLT